MKPGPNAISGSGPRAAFVAPADLSSGYQSWISSRLGPSRSPVGPMCAGSVTMSRARAVVKCPRRPTLAAAGRAGGTERAGDDAELAGVAPLAVGAAGPEAGRAAEQPAASAARITAQAAAREAMSCLISGASAWRAADPPR